MLCADVHPKQRSLLIAHTMQYCGQMIYMQHLTIGESSGVITYSRIQSLFLKIFDKGSSSTFQKATDASYFALSRDTPDPPSSRPNLPMLHTNQCNSFALSNGISYNHKNEFLIKQNPFVARSQGQLCCDLIDLQLVRESSSAEVFGSKDTSLTAEKYEEIITISMPIRSQRPMKSSRKTQG